MQLLLPQFLPLRGSDLASLRTEFPALSITLTSIPMESQKSLQAAFIFSVRSPAVRSMIKGAEILSALVWCQVVAFLSFFQPAGSLLPTPGPVDWSDTTILIITHLFLTFSQPR